MVNSFAVKRLLASLKTVFQYLMIYVLIGSLGSNWYSYLLPFYGKLAIVVVAIITMVLRTKRFYDWFLPCFVVACTTFTRFYVGGVGITSMVDLLLPVTVLIASVSLDREKFLRRFILAGTFLLMISLLCFAIQLINENLFLTPVFLKYLQVVEGSAGYESYLYGHGAFLYSFVERHPVQNCGIFVEPGLFQMLCNSILLCLLVFGGRIALSKKIKAMIIVIAVLSLISSKSTTGYIGFALVAFASLPIAEKKWRKMVILSLVTLLVVATVDYLVRGDGSLLSKTVISKMFYDGKIDLSVNTGMYRLETIKTCVSIISEHPFGVGYDFFNEVVTSSGAGAGLLVFAAVYGVPALVVVIVWLIAPCIKYKQYFLGIVLLCVFANMTLAQPYIFYPCLILPFYCLSALSSNSEDVSVNGPIFTSNRLIYGK